MIVSLTDASSTRTIFILIGQLQLILLLPLNNVYMPKDVIDFILQIKEAGFSLNLLSIQDLPILSELYEEYPNEEPHWYLSRIDVENMNSLPNLIPLIITFILYSLLHLLLTVGK